MQTELCILLCMPSSALPGEVAIIICFCTDHCSCRMFAQQGRNNFDTIDFSHCKLQQHHSAQGSICRFHLQQFQHRLERRFERTLRPADHLYRGLSPHHYLYLRRRRIAALCMFQNTCCSKCCLRNTAICHSPSPDLLDYPTGRWSSTNY